MAWDADRELTGTRPAEPSPGSELRTTHHPLWQKARTVVGDDDQANKLAIQMHKFVNREDLRDKEYKRLR